MNMIATGRRTLGKLWFLGTSVEILVSSGDSADGICMMRHDMPYGDSPPLHIHHNEDEIFHILAGHLHVRVGETDIHVGAGEAIVAPKGVPHTYRVTSREGARCLTVTRGTDFETMVCSLGRPALRPGLPAPVPVTPDMAAELAAVCARNGIDLVGPPLASEADNIPAPVQPDGRAPVLPQSEQDRINGLWFE